MLSQPFPFVQLPLSTIILNSAGGKLTRCERPFSSEYLQIFKPLKLM